MVTHTICREVNVRRVGSRSPRGSDPADLGRVHACAGPARPYDGAEYRTLCSMTIRAESNWDGDGYNVRPTGEQAVTCRRCKELSNA